MCYLKKLICRVSKFWSVRHMAGPVVWFKLLEHYCHWNRALDLISRHDLQSNKSMDPNNSDSGFLTMMSAKRVCEKSLLPADDHAFQKIAALEDELLQLRAQIAAIVALQQSQAAQSHTESLYSFGSPRNALPPPSSASTPLSAQFLQCTTPVAPLPLPPPPPPPPPVPSTQLKSALDLIRQCKGFHKCSPTESEASEKGSVDQLPSMMDVLKGMNSIKLRAVERSPGGKPSTRKDKKKRSLNDPTDPAAIIAKAWKHKFAHRNGDDAVNKENRSHDESPFSSPNGTVCKSYMTDQPKIRLMKDHEWEVCCWIFKGFIQDYFIFLL
ncbi:mitochondrial fission regulator 2-like isoform X1 [Phyllobates terribilis]|uniref:mitochondrial fission regulator 2-like isoform X1 n=2 Tax=Phyllobates terribilis TaxID=111132 RepID=UPI003CCB1615